MADNNSDTLPFDRPLNEWSVADLKRLLVKHGVDWSKCVEKVLTC